VTTIANASQKPPKTRRLSIFRLFIAIVVTAALVAAGVIGARSWYSSATTPEVDPWFAGYVDVTATPTFAFETPKSDAAQNVVLSFIVAKAGEECTPSWGNAYTMDEAANSLDLDRRIARLQQQGGEPIVSFGGLLNDELATACTDQTKLVSAYQSVIDRYSLTTIDLDIEAGNLTDTDSGARRAKAIASLQKSQKAAGKDLAVWLTLPVAPTGLTEDGTNAVTAFLDAGVDLAGVNVMTMDYGDSRVEGQSMLDASTSALEQTHRQLGILYSRAKVDLTSDTLWTKLGATPMIGQNDVRDEIFSLTDAKAFNTFVKQHNMGRMSMWSLNRDVTCSPNYGDARRVSDSCSGVPQGDASFADLLGKGINGDPVVSAAVTTTNEPIAEELDDDPATSPYQIWSPDSTYLLGTKVVWHQNVYSAKWWTRGDLPDNPVLETFETPWELVGPVLPGETPVPVPTVPPGAYPEWNGETTYVEGDRVIVGQYAFESKWYNQGEPPAAASTDPDSSPWVALTDAQVLDVIDGATATPTEPTAPATPAP
jgi:chitinase